MNTQELKKYINRVLGNKIRCLLPSFWWKKLFGAVVDEIESVEATANSVSKKVYSISGELRELTNDITSLSTDVDRKLSNKQDTLYSGNTIKTINGKSILGYGDIQIEDYTKTVTSKEALDDLEVRAGTIATVVSVDTSESATELSMSTCYKKPAGVSDYSLYNKLTPIRKVAIHVPSVNVSFKHMIELIKGNSYDDALYIIYDNGRVGYNIGNPGIRNLLVSDGQLIQSNIDALNDLLNSNDYRYYSTISSQGYGSWSDVEACRDSWVKRISLVSDSYIKEEDWIRLLKEGDVTGGTDGIISRTVYPTKTVFFGTEKDNEISETEREYNCETFRMAANNIIQLKGDTNVVVPLLDLTEESATFGLFKYQAVIGPEKMLIFASYVIDKDGNVIVEVEMAESEAVIRTINEKADKSDIKTINGVSLLGGGNLQLGDGQTIVYDDTEVKEVAYEAKALADLAIENLEALQEELNENIFEQLSQLLKDMDDLSARVRALENK